MSADPVEGVAGQDRQRLAVLPARSPQTGPHLRKSEKLNRTRPRARLEPAPSVADCSPPPATPQTRTLISAPDLSQNHCHIPQEYLLSDCGFWGLGTIVSA